MVLEAGSTRGVAMTTYKVGYFVGSLSSTSINRELSKVLIRLAPEELEFTEIPIRNLPLYSQDYDADFPPEALALKDAIHRSQAVLFVTPEYNRSIPGALKTPSTGPRGPGGRTRSTMSRPRRSAHHKARSAPRWPNRACAP
jgi:chromate reductase, NAD(P)H dehydrogenase (quinone)